MKALMETIEVTILYLNEAMKNEVKVLSCKLMLCLIQNMTTELVTKFTLQGPSGWEALKYIISLMLQRDIGLPSRSSLQSELGNKLRGHVLYKVRH